MAEKERLYFELIFTATDVGCFLNLWNYGIGCHNLFRENKIKKPPCQKKVSVNWWEDISNIMLQWLHTFEKIKKTKTPPKNSSFSSNLCGITGVVWNP